MLPTTTIGFCTGPSTLNLRHPRVVDWFSFCAMSPRAYIRLVSILALVAALLDCGGGNSGGGGGGGGGWRWAIRRGRIAVEPNDQHGHRDWHVGLSSVGQEFHPTIAGAGRRSAGYLDNL